MLVILAVLSIFIGYWLFKLSIDLVLNGILILTTIIKNKIGHFKD